MCVCFRRGPVFGVLCPRKTKGGILLSKKPPNTLGKQIRKLKRTMVEKRRESTPGVLFFVPSFFSQPQRTCAKAQGADHPGGRQPHCRRLGKERSLSARLRCGCGRRRSKRTFLGPPAIGALSLPLFGWQGSNLKLTTKKTSGTLILISLLEDLVLETHGCVFFSGWTSQHGATDVLLVFLYRQEGGYFLKKTRPHDVFFTPTKGD